MGQFITSLEQASAEALRLFRGQNTDQCLLPRIMRLAKENKISPAEIDKVEQRMLDRFRKECVPMLLTTKQLAAWELMSIAQHNGMPTRLLDWTANPLAGLWFAVASDPPKKKDRGVVWMLDRPNQRTFERDDNIFALEKTCFFQPQHLDRRIAAQLAWFSVYRHNKTDFLPLERQMRYADKVTRFVIQPNNFQPIRQQLRRLGINHATFFPDLSGLGADIQLEFIDATRRLDTV